MNEFSKFIRDLAVSLRTTKILYLGCQYIEDLSEFAKHMQIHGVIQNANILEKALEKYPNFTFKQNNPINTSYDNDQFDFVFTHKFFNYLDAQNTKKLLKEMYRISSKYIVNFELFSQKELFADTSGHFCDMYSKWLDFQVKIISNVQMHKEIDSEQSQFTLVRKIN